MYDPNFHTIKSILNRYEELLYYNLQDDFHTIKSILNVV